MLPAGPLMTEHRLIERMISLLDSEFETINKKGRVNITFLDQAIDFIRTYADRCHHGKEEDILFRELKIKDLSQAHKKILDELIKEHVYARENTAILSEAKNKYINGEKANIKTILGQLEKLVTFYPQHIRKEDDDFFIPSMSYFTKEEQEDMLNEFWEFDKKLIHENYKNLVESYE